MTSTIHDFYQTLSKKLSLLESNIKLGDSSEEYKQNYDRRLRGFQNHIEAIKNLASENASLKESLSEKLDKLKENRKCIDNFQIETISDSLNRQSVSMNSCESYSESTGTYSDLSPVPDRHEVISTSVPQKISFDTCPEIPFVGLKEFSSIPQYMRGRLHVDNLNSFIKRINDAAEEKYSLLKLRKNEVPRDRLAVYIEYKKLQEGSEKHLVFITPSDLGLKLVDKQTNNYLAMLRHTRRTKEIRDGGILKICLIR